MKELPGCILRLPLLVSLLITSLAHGAPRPARLEDCDDATCFFLIPEVLNFTSARDACSAENGVLATLPSPVETRKVHSLLLRSSGRFWIGLTLPDGRCPANDSAGYGYEWISEKTPGAAGVSGWAGFPDRCDHRCVSVSTNGSWQQEPCGGTVDGFLCKAPSGWCRVGERLAEPGEHNVSSGSTHARWSAPATEWTTTGEKDSQYIDSKWVCAYGDWWRAPWSCQVLNGGCAHTCLNNTCTCPDGQAIHANNVTCVDVQECSDTVSCVGEHTQCQRKPGGGSECVCRDGYEMEDGACLNFTICFSCEHHKCVTVGGAKACACRTGFVVSKENPSLCVPYCHRPYCPTTCVEGKCRCPTGYIHDQQDNASRCVDIDECEVEEPCAQMCENTHGGYACSCRPGFLTDGDRCVAAETTAGPDPFVNATPAAATLPPPAAGVPGYVRAGAALGITAFVAVGAALLYLLLRCALARCCGTLEVSSLRGADTLTLQPVTTEKYQRFSFDKQSRAETLSQQW